MTMIIDILLLFACIGAGLYCMVLSRRLSKFCDLENGVGGAVAIMAVQVDDLQKTLEAAQKTSGATAENLKRLNSEAQASAAKLELLIASLGDIGEPGKKRQVRRTRKLEEGEAA